MLEAEASSNQEIISDLELKIREFKGKEHQNANARAKAEQEMQGIHAQLRMMDNQLTKHKLIASQKEV